MNPIARIKGICFSPVGTTKRVVEMITKRFSELLSVPFEVVSYTLPGEREHFPEIEPDEFVVWGTPVYAGRIPNKTLNFVAQNLKAQGNRAVVVAVYGNRSFGDTLAEMTSVAEGGGMIPVAAAGVVANHAFSDKIAAGRPDEKDRGEIMEFCETVVEKDLLNSSAVGTLEVPGTKHPLAYYTPLGKDLQPAKFLKAFPVADDLRCRGCGTCVDHCPMATIRLENGKPVFEGTCIKCQACIRKCPQGALRMEDKDFLSHKEMLEQNCQEARLNEFFFAKP